MAIKEKHLRALEAARSDHVRRIDELRKQIKLQEDEIQAHTLILAVSGNRDLMSALVKATEDPNFFGDLDGREIEYLKSLNIELPPESRMMVERKKNSIHRIDLCVRTGEYSFRMTWSAAAGFFTSPI